MRRSGPVLALVCFLAVGCGSNKPRWDEWQGQSRAEADAAAERDAAAFRAMQDSLAFLKALNDPARHSEALAYLWGRVNRSETESREGQAAGFAAMAAGIGLVIIGVDQLGAISDAESVPGVEVEGRGTWYAVTATGAAAALVGLMSSLVD
jgi:hypothetical protein